MNSEVWLKMNLRGGFYTSRLSAFRITNRAIDAKPSPAKKTKNSLNGIEYNLMGEPKKYQDAVETITSNKIISRIALVFQVDARWEVQKMWRALKTLLSSVPNSPSEP